MTYLERNPWVWMLTTFAILAVVHALAN